MRTKAHPKTAGIVLRTLSALAFVTAALAIAFETLLVSWSQFSWQEGVPVLLYALVASVNGIIFRIAAELPGRLKIPGSEQAIVERLNAIARLFLVGFFVDSLSALWTLTSAVWFPLRPSVGVSVEMQASGMYFYKIVMSIMESLVPLFVPRFYGAASLLLILLLMSYSKSLEEGSALKRRARNERTFLTRS